MCIFVIDKLLRGNYKENKDGRGHAIGVVEGKIFTKHS